MTQPISVDKMPQELLEALEKLKNQSIDEIEQMIDEMKLKEKEGGSFVVLRQEYYTTTH